MEINPAFSQSANACPAQDLDRRTTTKKISAGDEGIGHVALMVVVSLNRLVSCYIKSYRSEVEGI